MIVAGNKYPALIAVGGKKLMFYDSGLFADSPKKFIVLGLKNSVKDTLQFAESSVDFRLNFNHLVWLYVSNSQLKSSSFTYSALKSVTISRGIRLLSSFCFRNCRSFSSISLENDSRLRCIESSTFF
jgi:hypothetical protein